MFCTHCGKKNPEQANYCFSCGSLLPTAAASESPAPSPTEAIGSNADRDPIAEEPPIATGAQARRVTAKRCPSCGLPNREAAERCACGYNFAEGLASVGEIQFEFTGRGRDILSGEGLKMVLQYISIVGIPWGWLTTFRWVTRKTSLSTGTALTFDGTVGQAWGFAALFMFMGVLNRWDFSDAEMFRDAPIVLGVTALVWIGIHWGLTAFIQLEFLKWEIERTSPSSGLKPVFRGGFLASFGWQVLTIVSIFTVIGWAWVMAAYFRWVCRKTDVDGYHGRFEGSGLQILWRCFVAILACIPIVTIPAVFCWWCRWFFSQVKGVLEPTVAQA